MVPHMASEELTYNKNKYPLISSLIAGRVSAIRKDKWLFFCCTKCILT